MLFKFAFQNDKLLQIFLLLISNIWKVKEGINFSTTNLTKINLLLYIAKFFIRVNKEPEKFPVYCFAK